MSFTPREVRQSDASLLLATVSVETTLNALLTTMAQVVSGVKGTQVSKSNIVASTGSSTLHTVTAAKTFYLTAARIAFAIDANYSAPSSLQVQNAAASAQYNILEGNDNGAVGAGTGQASISFPYPIAIPAGFLIVTISQLNCTISAFIHGFEV